MTLTGKDIQSIGKLIDSNNDKMLVQIKDIVEFAIEKSELRLTEKIEKVATDVNDFRQEMHREISDIAEVNRGFLGKAHNHDVRIERLEVNAGIAAD